MKKIIILIILILFLCGCQKNNNKVNNDNCLVSICDTEYGIEYLRDTCVYHGGITVRLDKNGNVIHCNKGSDNNE